MFLNISEMSVPATHDMKEAIDATNEAEQLETAQPDADKPEDSTEKTKKKSTPGMYFM